MLISLLVQNNIVYTILIEDKYMNQSHFSEVAL